MNGGSLFHLTDEALQLVLLICVRHLSHLSFLTFGLFCVSSCKGFVPLPAQKYDPSCWWHSGSCFWRPSVTLCYGYLKHELVALRYHADEPGQKIVSLDVVHGPEILSFSGFVYLHCYESDLITVKSRGRLQTATNICNRNHHQHLILVHSDVLEETMCPRWAFLGAVCMF